MRVRRKKRGSKTKDQPPCIKQIPPQKKRYLDDIKSLQIVQIHKTSFIVPLYRVIDTILALTNGSKPEEKCPLLLLIQRLPRLHIRPKNPLPKVPRQHIPIIPHMHPRRHTKHLIQLLQTQRLGLRKTKVRKRPPEHVPRGVPPERALWLERRFERRPGQTHDEVEEPGCRCREGHADVPDVQRECFGGVGEGYGTLAGRVDDHEEVDSCGDAAEAGGFGGDVEGEAGEEEKDGHQGEGGEEEVASAEGVDCVDGGDGEDPVYDAAAEGGEEGVFSGEVGGYEHGRRVVHDCVDAAELEVISRDRPMLGEYLPVA